MKVLKVILIILAVVIGAILIIPAFLSNEATVERSVTVNTEPEKPFLLVNDLNRWVEWSPWYKMDTASIMTYSDNPIGANAWYTWDSKNGDIGTGKLTITKSESPSLIEVDLKFGEWEPQAATYSFEKVGEKETKVSQSMHLEMEGYFMRYLVWAMKANLAHMFDQGLKNIKTTAEAMPDIPAEPASVGRIENMQEMQTEPMIYLSKTDSIDSKAIGSALERIYGEIFVEAGKQGLTQQGAPFAMYHSWNPEGKSFVEPGIPMDKMPAKAEGFNAVSMDATMVIGVDYYGPYDASGMAHDAVYKYVGENGYEMTGSPWEIYVTDPTTVDDPSKILTKIFYPVKRKAEATQ